MSLKTTLFAGVAALSLAMPAFADGITIHDPYARASAASSQSGAAFMEIMNQTDTDDRLVAARSDVARRMMEVEEGFAIPAGATHALARGGDHVMFMGLNQSFEHGDEIEVTLVFEQAGEVTVTIPIDLERNPMRGGAMGNGQTNMSHGNMNHANMGGAASD